MGFAQVEFLSWLQTHCEGELREVSLGLELLAERAMESPPEVGRNAVDGVFWGIRTLSKAGPHCLEFVGRPMVEEVVFCWNDSQSNRGARRLVLCPFWLLPQLNPSCCYDLPGSRGWGNYSSVIAHQYSRELLYSLLNQTCTGWASTYSSHCIADCGRDISHQV